MHALSRTILVTGATGGIGLAVCERLAKGGASLLLAARDVPKLRSLCTELPDNGSGGHTWIRVDMTNDESIQQFADELAARDVILDGAVLMPPQDPPTSDPLPSSAKWREILQDTLKLSFSIRWQLCAAQPPSAEEPRAVRPGHFRPLTHQENRVANDWSQGTAD